MLPSLSLSLPSRSLFHKSRAAGTSLLPAPRFPRRSTNLPDSGLFSQGLFFPFPLFPEPARPADKMALYGLSFLLSSIFRKKL